MISDSEEEEEIYSRESIQQRNKMPSRLILLTVLSAIGGFLFGYDTGVISGAMVLIKSDINLSSVWHELIVSGTVGSACLAAVLTGTLADRFGRRPAILISSVHFFLGAMVMAASTGKVTLFVGRLIVGLGVGMASMAVPLYIGECSPPELRGVLVTINIVAVTFGQLCAGVVCGCLVDTDNGWRYMVGIPVVPALLQLIGFSWMPESPRFLVKRENFTKAQLVLSSIRGPYHQVHDELEDIKISCGADAAAESRSTSFLSFLAALPRSRHARKSVLLGCTLQFMQQILGINTVMYYSASIIKMAGATTRQAVWFSAVTGGVNFTFTLVGLRLVERLNRRTLLFGSLVGSVISLLLIAASFQFMASQGLSSTFPASNSSSTGPLLTSSSLNNQSINMNSSFEAEDWSLQNVNRTDFARSRRMTDGKEKVNSSSSTSSSGGSSISSSISSSGDKSGSSSSSNSIITSNSKSSITNGSSSSKSSITNNSSKSSIAGSSHGSNKGSVTLVLEQTGGANSSAEQSAPVAPDSDATPDSPVAPVVVLVTLCLYLMTFAPGVGPLPWAVNSEIHPAWCRAQAQSLATASNWLGNLLISLTFLSLTESMGRPATFCLYAVSASLCGLVLFIFLPESKGVKLEEVEQLFAREAVTAASGTSSSSSINRGTRVLYTRLGSS